MVIFFLKEGVLRTTFFTKKSVIYCCILKRGFLT
jgi:hypothetical protein